jgi:hypothetical protein
LGKPATTTMSPSRVASLPVSQAQPNRVQSNEAAYEPVEWAKVVFAAKAHGDASISSPTPTPTRLAAEPTRPHPVPSVKKRVRLPRPGIRMPDGFASAQFDRPWERHAERRGGFGLFFFGRFARAE